MQTENPIEDILQSSEEKCLETFETFTPNSVFRQKQVLEGGNLRVFQRFLHLTFSLLLQLRMHITLHPITFDP